MSFANSDFGTLPRADMKFAPTTEMPNQHYEERTVPRHFPKSVGAAARRRVLANKKQPKNSFRLPLGEI